MQARRWWVLLLMAAVFSMHAAQYAASDPGTGHGAMVASQSAPGDRDTGPSLVGAVGAGEEFSVSVVGTAPGTTGLQMPSGPGHDVADHLLSLCVAALLAAHVLVGAVILGRRVAPDVARDEGLRTRLPMGWFRLPRPPDLASLCLLRI